MIKLFKDIIKSTNDSLILATPLILFMWVLPLYVGYMKNSVNNIASVSIFFITVIFMTAAFFAGWFYMVKNAVQLSKQTFVSEEEKSKEFFSLLKVIPTGIGEYFLSSLGLIFCSIFIIFLIGYLTFSLGMHLIGDLGIDPVKLRELFGSGIDMKTFLDSLSQEQLLKLSNWNLLILAVTSITTFLSILWIPEIFYKNKNPFVALFTSIKKIFVRFSKTFKLFIFMTVLNLVLSFINTFSIMNSVLYFIMMMVYFYFIIYLAMLIFTYYDKEFE